MNRQHKKWESAQFSEKYNVYVRACVVPYFLGLGTLRLAPRAHAQLLAAEEAGQGL